MRPCTHLLAALPLTPARAKPLNGSASPSGRRAAFEKCDLLLALFLFGRNLLHGLLNCFLGSSLLCAFLGRGFLGRAFLGCLFRTSLLRGCLNRHFLGRFDRLGACLFNRLLAWRHSLFCRERCCCWGGHYRRCGSLGSIRRCGFWSRWRFLFRFHCFLPCGHGGVGRPIQRLLYIVLQKSIVGD
jgi:hypothetical protein